MRRDQNVPLCHTEPVPVTPKGMHPLAKALPTSAAGDICVTTQLRKGKDQCTAAVSERTEKEYVRETVLQTARSVKKEGDRVLQAPKQTLPCFPWGGPC